PVSSNSILIGFTTDQNRVPAHPRIVPVRIFEDPSLGVHKISHPNVLQHRTIAIDGRLAWEALYPQGSINPSGALKGGFGFYVAGPKAFADALDEYAREIVLGYEVLFESGFSWAKGGKLPGLYGGVGDKAYGCTGGRKAHRCQCFNLRFMWRANGEGELYTYLPQTDVNLERLRTVPGAHESSDYGFSLGRGAWGFNSGRWMSLGIRLRLNDVGFQNGEIEAFIDGRSVLLVDRLVLREDHSARIRGAHFQTFFGGHTPDWASPRDQKSWFASLSGAVVK
ncbi:hypothetical protein F5148DRAFT_1261108, partial [Russula earlei]